MTDTGTGTELTEATYWHDEYARSRQEYWDLRMERLELRSPRSTWRMVALILLVVAANAVAATIGARLAVAVLAACEWVSA